jgi:hypothetical protein
VEPLVRLCRLCQTRPVTAARLKWHDYRCHPCRKLTPAYHAANARYERTERRTRLERARNKRRIWIGQRYHSFAASPELAQRINAHLKGRLNAFKGQQAGA